MDEDTKKILIVDDDPKNVFALSAVLRSRRYPCLSVNSGEDCISVLSDRDDIGIVLMDMMMPEMDGYTAIPLIKKNEKTKSVPVIAVTAQAMIGDKEKCLRAGADDYISKPVDTDRLLEILNKFLK